MPIRTTWPAAAAALLMCMAVLAGTASSAFAQARTGWTDAQLVKRSDEYARLTPAQVASSVQVHDDSLEPVAVLTTERAFTFRGGFTDRVRADSFLRAMITKSTGSTTVQVYETLSYTGDRRDFAGATYETADGPQAAPLTLSRDDTDCHLGVCVHHATLGFDVPIASLQWIATRAGERPPQPWRFRFKAGSGEDWTDDIAPAEVAGLLQAVDDWRKAHQQR